MGARLIGWTGAAALVGVLLTGCGSDADETADDPATPSVSATDTDSTSPSPTVAASDAPATAPAGTAACAQVWQGDAVLAKRYAGCADEAGLLAEPDEIGCSSGQSLVRYDDRYWAVRGGTIHDAEGALLDSDAYRDDLETCRG